MQGEGSPHPWSGAEAEWKGRSAAEVCTSEARKIGEAPCGARSGQSPLAQACLPLCTRRVPDYWEGVAGGNGPLRFSLAYLDFSLLFRGVQRGGSLLKRKRLDHEGIELLIAAKGFQWQETYFWLPITAQ